MTEVARFEPSVLIDGLSGGFLILVIAEHHRIATHPDFTVLADRCGFAGVVTCHFDFELADRFALVFAGDFNGGFKFA